MVFVPDEASCIPSNPTLTEVARYEGEIGRIEFKACDSCSDFSLYAALLALLKGLCLDETLLERSMVPDTDLHQFSAMHGFDDVHIQQGAISLLLAAEGALINDPDKAYLASLWALLNLPQSSSAYQLRTSFITT